MGLFNWLKKQAPTTITTPIATPIDIPPPDQIVNAWKSIIIDKSKSWVVFSHGTCVVLIMQPLPDLQLQAIELMRKYGPVHTGSPAGDFSIIDLTNYPGWAVTCHHNDILTYVAPDELNIETISNDVTIGLYGRAKRNLDALRAEVIHVEDKRNEK
jgi:hypothetical protein